MHLVRATPSTHNILLPLFAWLFCVLPVCVYARAGLIARLNIVKLYSSQHHNEGCRSVERETQRSDDR